MSLPAFCLRCLSACPRLLRYDRNKNLGLSNELIKVELPP